MSAVWEHLLPLVSALEQSGNAVGSPGFQPVEAGYECVMANPLDFDLLRGLVSRTDKNMHLGTTSDLLWCSHCWAAIIGPRRIAEAEEARSG